MLWKVHNLDVKYFLSTGSDKTEPLAHAHPTLTRSLYQSCILGAISIDGLQKVCTLLKVTSTH